MWSKKIKPVRSILPVIRNYFLRTGIEQQVIQVLKDDAVAACYTHLKKALAFSLAFDKAAKDFYQAKKRRWYTHSKRHNGTKEYFQRLVPSF